jgi:phenylacetate-CoA ligase
VNFYKLDPAEQRRASAQRLFQYLRHYVGPYHPFLRRHYRENGVDLSMLSGADDVARLPIIDKTHLQSDPQLFVLRPAGPEGPPLPQGYETAPLRKSTLSRYLMQALLDRPRDYSRLVRPATLRQAVRRRALMEWQPIHYHVSTGSTGTPTPVMYTHYDFKHALAELTLIVPRPERPEPNRVYFDWTDRMMNVFPGAPHMAFFGPVLTKILAGLPSFETFGGALIPTDRQITIFAAGGFSSLIAIPSYLVHWLRRAAVLMEQGTIGPLTSLKSAVVGAEPLSESQRNYIRKLAIGVGAHPHFTLCQTFGMTELKWTGCECAEGSGIHLNPKYFFCELLHPETQEPVRAGEPGVLVFSHIGWRGTVLIRYWTGDLIKGGMHWERCSHCGYTFPSLYPPICRADKDFTKIKGTRVDLSMLVEVVRDTPGVRQFQIALENAAEDEELSRDVLVVHVTPERDGLPVEIEQRVRERIKSFTEISPDRVEFELDENAMNKQLFARNGIKAEYLIERRTTHV